MATVYLMACTTTPNISTNTYSGWCPTANRRAIAVDDVVIQGTTLEVAAKDTIDPARVQDMYLLFIAFIGVFATIWGLKQLQKIFNGDFDRG